MRIFEITDKNKTILSISGIDETSFNDQYQQLIRLLNVLITLKSPSRNQNLLATIEEFETAIVNTLNNKLLDKKDPDIIILMNKLKEMLSNIRKLKSQLIL